MTGKTGKDNQPHRRVIAEISLTVDEAVTFVETPLAKPMLSGNNPGGDYGPRGSAGQG